MQIFQLQLNLQTLIEFLLILIMKIAAVHCRLFPGGALEVFKDLLQQELRNDPKAEIKIFTMIADENLKTLHIQIP